MPESSTPASSPAAPYVSFEEFRRGISRGAFRVIVDPVLSNAFLFRRLNVLPVSVAVVGSGIASALAGYLWLGAFLVAMAILFRRMVKWQAPKIVLHLASSHEPTYVDATSGGVMEVRRAHP